MTTNLAKQIATRMKAKNLTVTILEKEAGVKSRSITNILRGKSKKPNAELLQAIADTLGCDLRELLSSSDILNDDNINTIPRSKLLEAQYEYPELFKDVIDVIIESLNGKEELITIKQLLNCVEEVFLHSLQKNLQAADKDFTEWYVNLMLQSK